MEWRVSQGGVESGSQDSETYQEHDSDVQHECNNGVQDQSEEADAINVAHGHARHLDEEGNDTVDQGACGCVVVQGHKGVHLELGRAQHALDHDETEGLENDTAALVCIAKSAMGACMAAAEAERDHGQTKPTKSNLISPNEAITTPSTIMPTLPSTFMLGGAMPKAQVANRVTTAFVAWCSNCQPRLAQTRAGIEGRARCNLP